MSIIVVLIVNLIAKLGFTKSESAKLLVLHPDSSLIAERFRYYMFPANSCPKTVVFNLFAEAED